MKLISFSSQGLPCTGHRTARHRKLRHARALTRVGLAGLAGLALGTLQGCGAQSSESSAHIVGGEVVTPAVAAGPEFTSTVAITSEAALAAGRSYCSGTLIDAQLNLVLTAAHCFEDIASGKHFVSFGTSVSNARNAPLRRAIAVVKHPEYDHALTVQTARYAKPSHDIALVRFEGSVPYGFRATPLSAPTDALSADMVLAGYGTTGALRTDARTGSPLFDSKGLPVTQSDTGTLRRVDVGLSRVFPAGKVFDVAGKNGKPEGACPGDSGGPAYAKVSTGSEAPVWRVFGVLSTGRVGGVDTNGDGEIDVGCVGKNTYTDVRAYAEFIAMATRRLSPPSR